MPVLVPTLNFGGQCEEALQLYKKAFQAEVLCLLRYEDGNKEDCHWNLSEEQKKYIYHAELLIGEQRIMMCDNIDVPFQTSMATFLTVSFAETVYRNIEPRFQKVLHFLQLPCTVYHFHYH